MKLNQLQIEQAGQIALSIKDSQRLVVFTGAGISTESGIPDFRSPGGIWTKYDPEDFTIQKFRKSAESRRMQWKALTESGLMTDAQPNRAHKALAGLENMGKLDCIITQNIDNLHQKAGNSPEIIFELHGNMGRAVCLHCGAHFPMPDILRQLEKNSEPLCDICCGMLKPDVVLFGETLPADVLREATRRSSKCDLFLVIGSSLAVFPAAYMPAYAREAGAKLVILNAGTTAYDHYADILVNAGAGDIMEEVMNNLRGIL